jgi:Animal haem peroxidase
MTKSTTDSGDTADKPYRLNLLWRLYDRLATEVDHHIGWFKLPKPLGLLDLIGIRNTLREQNLYDTSREPSVNTPEAPPYDPAFDTERSFDGSWNDLAHPEMGMAGARFGRNVPLDVTWPDKANILEPNPRVISRRLMTRGEIIPATAGNALIASWLQFMIRDWFKHGTSPADNPWVLTLEPDDDWPTPPLTVMRTPDDPTSPPQSERPPTYINTKTHWWDGSQVYGNNLPEQEFLRSHEGGTLRLEDGHQPLPDDPKQNPALTPGFWLGVGMMQTLFAREHNSICRMLAEAHPDFDDEMLFQRARLINAGLLAKIHTVEWTPAVTAHPTAVTALHANWYGLAGKNLYDAFGRLSSNEVVSGIPGSHTEEFGVPFALTEEFVAVYRMHPLIPDHFDFRSAMDDQPTLGAKEFDELAGPAAVDLLRDNDLADLIYTFGTMNPGIVTLHNFPKYLQTFKRPDNGKLMDLAATDILRCRELGVPRYTRFRQLLHLRVPKTFEEITSNKQWAAELRDVYGQLDRVDLISGMYAEDRPEGFAFSDTAFRIFILMASRRLNSDRFFTEGFTEDVYTREGMSWINDNTMITVLLRHCPQLLPYLSGLENAFAIWNRDAGGM